MKSSFYSIIDNAPDSTTKFENNNDSSINVVRLWDFKEGVNDRLELTMKGFSKVTGTRVTMDSEMIAGAPQYYLEIRLH